MKKIKRALAIALCGAVIMTSTAFAVEPENKVIADFDSRYTKEEAMPEIPLSYGVTAMTEAPNTLSMPERQAWASDTAEILEGAYGERVSSIYETDSTIVFEFEEPRQEDFQFGVNYVMKDVYMKPEAQARATNYSTKISYVYGFGEGMYEDGTYDVDNKYGMWSAIKDTTITVIGLLPHCSVASAVLSLCGISKDYFSQNQVVKIDSLVQYYAINKIGMVKDPMTGMWVPQAYVGLRKEFRNFYIFEDHNGYLLKVGEDVTVPNNYVNPTNADETRAKAHFFEDDWIMDKAVSIYESEGRIYYDVFMMFEKFPTDKYPSA
jgi:hypothetical protein